VGVGSDTIQNVMDQLSVNYNVTHATGKLYSWDATNPVTGAMGDTIQLKSGSSTCSIKRPDGSSAGILQLTTGNGTTTGGQPCINFARSSRARASGDPNTISFITLAGDAVTVATQPGTHAPLNLLTTSVLTGIYNCTITTWNAIPGNSGGSTSAIVPMLPQDGSGTRAFFLGAINLGTGTSGPGPCVSTSATAQGTGHLTDDTLQENEGVAPSLNTNPANVIFPFSVAKYIAEKFHSASCGTISACFAKPNNCHPTATQNLFGCNTHGTMLLNRINNTSPTVGSGGNTKVNPKFTSTFTRFVYDVVDNPPGVTKPVVPPAIAKYFGPTGFSCTNTTAKNDLKKYGFLVLPPGTTLGHCGAAS
jgi:hypothetical protein